MDYNDTYAGEFSYHNITRSQISIDKYNGQSNRVEIPEKISGQEVIEIGEGAFSDNLILEYVQLPDSVTVIKDNAYYGLTRNAETLKVATVEIAKEAERSVVDIATLKRCNQQFISSINEVVKIHEQGAKKRQDAEVELVKVEEELKRALLEAGSK